MRCWACREDKPAPEFYQSRVKKDGTGKCKACVCSDVSANRSANLDHYQSRDRARAFNPDRVALRDRVREARRVDPIKKAADDQRKREWASANAEARAAHIIVGNAIRDGRLTKPDRCERCGEPEEKLEAHHEDYSQPLRVNWLCDPCHGLRHREINAERRAAA